MTKLYAPTCLAGRQVRRSTPSLSPPPKADKLIKGGDNLTTTNKLLIILLKIKILKIENCLKIRN
jgi:hypothetical protein